MATQIATSRCGVTFAATDYGTVIVLTPCCKADGKGSTDGIVCRGCYAPVPNIYGGSGIISDKAINNTAFDFMRKAVAKLGNCPCADDCAIFTMHDLMEGTFTIVPHAA